MTCGVFNLFLVDWGNFVDVVISEEFGSVNLYCLSQRDIRLAIERFYFCRTAAVNFTNFDRNFVISFLLTGKIDLARWKLFEIFLVLRFLPFPTLLLPGCTYTVHLGFAFFSVLLLDPAEMVQLVPSTLVLYNIVWPFSRLLLSTSLISLLSLSKPHRFARTFSTWAPVQKISIGSALIWCW